MSQASATYLDTVVGQAIAVGLLAGGAVMGLVGLGLGAALQATGALPALTETQMNLFVLEVAAVGALAGALMNGRRVRRTID
ncbi:MAG: hypothetical protein AAFX09_06540 [Pseudomonadota bacterium]